MAPRNTNTGTVLENMILPALKRGGYSYQQQVQVGTRLGGRGKHFVDAVAEKEDEKILVSSKWQQTAGTAEQKVPFEIMCLVATLHEHPNVYKNAYLVLGGEGWTLRDFYIHGGLSEYLKDTRNVHIVTLEGFIGLANGSKL